MTPGSVYILESSGELLSKAPQHRESGRAHAGKTNRPLNILSILGQHHKLEAMHTGESASFHLIAVLKTPPRAFPGSGGKVPGFAFISFLML